MFGDIEALEDVEAAGDVSLLAVISVGDVETLAVGKRLGGVDARTDLVVFTSLIGPGPGPGPGPAPGPGLASAQWKR